MADVVIHASFELCEAQQIHPPKGGGCGGVAGARKQRPRGKKKKKAGDAPKQTELPTDSAENTKGIDEVSDVQADSAAVAAQSPAAESLDVTMAAGAENVIGGLALEATISRLLVGKMQEFVTAWGVDPPTSMQQILDVFDAVKNVAIQLAERPT